MRERVLGGGHGHGLVAGLDAGEVGGVEVVRGEGVAGELGPAAVRVLGQDGGVRGVQPDPLARQQVVVHRLGHERVPEDVPAPAGGELEDVGVDGVAERGVEAFGGQGGDVGQHAVRDAPAPHRGDAHDRPRVVGEPVEAHEQQVGQLPGQVLGVVALLGGRDELLGEEGVAVGPR